MSRQARLGLIVLAGILAFAVGLFIIANRTFLLSETYQVRATFNHVSGLQAGAQVFYGGITVGRVEEVKLPSQPQGPIEVTMQIRSDARRLIRRDSRALIQSDGLVGNTIVAIAGGTEAQPELQPGGRLEGVDPLQLSAITDRMLTSVSRFDSVTVTLTQIMQDVRSGEGTLGRLIYDPSIHNELVLTARETRTALQDITREADALVTIAADASSDLRAVIQKVSEGDGTLARLINDDAFYTNLTATTAQLQVVVQDLGAVANRAEDASNWGALAMFRLAENMEALKHNFLFKRYYEERGYLEQAPFEIRERALSETYEALEARARELQREAERLEALRRDLSTMPDAARPNAGAPDTLATPTSTQ